MSSSNDPKTLMPEVLPTPQETPAESPRKRVWARMRRLLAETAIAGGVVTAVGCSCVACDPLPPPSADGGFDRQPPPDGGDAAMDAPDGGTDAPDGGDGTGG